MPLKITEVSIFVHASLKVMAVSTQTESWISSPWDVRALTESIFLTGVKPSDLIASDLMLMYQQDLVTNVFCKVTLSSQAKRSKDRF